MSETREAVTGVIATAAGGGCLWERLGRGAELAAEWVRVKKIMDKAVNRRRQVMPDWVAVKRLVI